MKFIIKILFLTLLSSSALAQHLKKDYSPFGFDLTPNPVLESDKTAVSEANYGNSSYEDVPIQAHNFHINHKSE